jgi:hypothetical protein
MSSIHETESHSLPPACNDTHVGEQKQLQTNSNRKYVKPANRHKFRVGQHDHITVVYYGVGLTHQGVDLACEPPNTTKAAFGALIEELGQAIAQQQGRSSITTAQSRVFREAADSASKTASSGVSYLQASRK